MAIGLSTRKNLSESNLNLKTAIQKLYAPGIEDDITLFSLSSSIESICFSGLVDDEDSQIVRLTTERLRTISGQVLKRTKFNTKFFTFTDDNEVYFKNYTAGIGNDTDAEAPTFSDSGSIPSVKALSGGEGFYFLDSLGNSGNLCRKIGTWTASSSQTITVTLTDHGFVAGQTLELRFNNTGGGTAADYGFYTVTEVTSSSTFTVTHGSSITGSGSVLIKFFTLTVQNVALKGSSSGAVNARATVQFTLKEPIYLRGSSATYTNTTTGTSLGSNPETAPDVDLPSVTIVLANHGLSTGNRVYIQVLGGSAKSSYVSVTRVDNNSFTAKLICPSTNSAASCRVLRVEELTKWTPNTIERFSASSVTITDKGTNYVVPENISLIESNVTLQSNSQTLRFRKQAGSLFAQKPEILRTDNFRYVVKGATNGGFYLYDPVKMKYLFLDRSTGQAGLSTEQVVELRRADNIYVENFLQFKYAQSTIYLRDYQPTLSSMGSLLDQISQTSNAANFIKERSTQAIQNTRRPVDVTSSENIFGYNYNIFEGANVIIKQRVVVRDQDYVLDPNNSSISGDRLRETVDRFVLGPLASWSATASSIVTITQNSHGLSTGDTVKIRDVVATGGTGFGAGQYTITVVNDNSFTIATSATITGSGTLALITDNPDLQIRVPGLFVKVGENYKRAFSTDAKPFFQSISSGIANPALNISSSDSNYGALSAENTLLSNPIASNWYSYSVTISELAQRIHTNGKDGAFYYHRTVKPNVTTVTTLRNEVSGSIYSVPLFSVAS